VKIGCVLRLSDLLTTSLSDRPYAMVGGSGWTFNCLIVRSAVRCGAQVWRGARIVGTVTLSRVEGWAFRRSNTTPSGFTLQVRARSSLAGFPVRSLTRNADQWGSGN